MIPKIITIGQACELLKEKTNFDFSPEIRVAVQKEEIKAAQDFQCFSIHSANYSYVAPPSIDVIKADALIYTDSLKSYFSKEYGLSLDDSIQQPVPEKLANNDEVNQKEKRSYLLLIAALCKANKIDLNERGAAKRLEELTDSELSIGYKTILKIVDEIKNLDFYQS